MSDFVVQDYNRKQYLVGTGKTRLHNDTFNTKSQSRDYEYKTGAGFDNRKSTVSNELNINYKVLK